MPRINLDNCPITMDSLNGETFNQTRLVIVGNTIYPVIGEEAWNQFTRNLHSCPFTRSAGDYRVLTISALPENLRTQLHAWLLTDDIVDNTAPQSAAELAALLVSQPDSTNYEELGGVFIQHLVERNFSTPPVTAFFQPAPEQERWRKRMNAWEPYDSGGEINRAVSYRNLRSNHIKGVDFYGYNDGTYSIGIEAGHDTSLWGAGMPTVEHNQSLITKLQERNFNADTANVTKYPTIDNQYNCYFEIRGTLDDIAHQFDSMLGIVEDLEGPGSTQSILNEMQGRFQPAPPPQLN